MQTILIVVAVIYFGLNTFYSVIDFIQSWKTIDYHCDEMSMQEEFNNRLILIGLLLIGIGFYMLMWLYYSYIDQDDITEDK